MMRLRFRLRLREGKLMCPGSVSFTLAYEVQKFKNLNVLMRSTSDFSQRNYAAPV
jgi:hypothetical protein